MTGNKEQNEFWIYTFRKLKKFKSYFLQPVFDTCERAEIGKQTGLKILRVVTPLWVQVPPLAPIRKMKLHNHIIAFYFSTLLISFDVRGNDLEEKIKDFILKNPEIIIESLQKFEVKKENEKKIENKNKINILSQQIYNSESLFEGNEQANKVIVEFFDYNCSYCKRAHQDLKKIISQDKNIKVIYKNYPILSENSIKLAKYALIISEIDKKKFVTFHNLILTNKGVINDNILTSILTKLNIDKNSLEDKLDDTEINQKLKNDIDLARNLGLRGTPAFIISDEIFFGYIDKEDMVSILNQQ